MKPLFSNRSKHHAATMKTIHKHTRRRCEDDDDSAQSSYRRYLTMSAAHRSLARLPLEVFENLVSSNYESSLLISEEEEEQVDNDEDLPVHVGNDAAMLRQAICQKLKSIPPSKQMPHRRKSLRLAAATAVNNNAAALGNGNTSSTINNNKNATLLDSIQTFGSLLFMSKPALLRALDPLLTYDECSELIRRICIYCSPTPKSAMALMHMTSDDLDDTPSISKQQQQHHHHEVENMSATTMVPRRHIPTGLGSLDHQLRGGVRVGTLTEIVGMTATAKSQMAMQLCIMASHLLRGAVYIDSENKMSLQRLEEMAMYASRRHVQQQRQEQLLLLSSSLTSQPLNLQRHIHEEEAAFRHCRDFLANVSVHTPTTMDELDATLALVEDDIYLRNEQAAAAALLQQQQQQQHDSTRRVETGTMTTTATFPVRLLILDSIAAPARREFGSGSAPQRAAAVMKCAQTLKRLADELQLAVVVLNQVDQQQHHSTSISSSLQQQQQQQQQHLPPPRAALGTAWHHCVSTRIHLLSLMSRQPGGDGTLIDTPSSSSSTITQQEQITRIPRMASVVKSNVTGQGPAVCFEVTTRGLVEMLLPHQHQY